MTTCSSPKMPITSATISWVGSSGLSSTQLLRSSYFASFPECIARNNCLETFLSGVARRWSTACLWNIFLTLFLLVTALELSVPKKLGLGVRYEADWRVLVGVLVRSIGWEAGGRTGRSMGRSFRYFREFCWAPGVRVKGMLGSLADDFVTWLIGMPWWVMVVSALIEFDTFLCIPMLSLISLLWASNLDALEKTSSWNLESSSVDASCPSKRASCAPVCSNSLRTVVLKYSMEVSGSVDDQ